MRTTDSMLQLKNCLNLLMRKNKKEQYPEEIMNKPGHRIVNRCSGCIYLGKMLSLKA